MLGGVLVVLGGTTVAYLSGGRYVGTDDAYVKAAQLNVTTDVSGMVKSVEVHEGQRVAAGEVLFRLDPEPFEIALANAKATLLQAEMTVGSLKADYRKAMQQTSAQQAMVDVAKTTLDRYAVARETRIDRADAVGSAAGDVSVGVGDGEFARAGGRGDAGATQRQSGSAARQLSRRHEGARSPGRSAASARSHGRARAVRRHRHRGQFAAARHADHLGDVGVQHDERRRPGVRTATCGSTRT